MKIKKVISLKQQVPERKITMIQRPLLLVIFSLLILPCSAFAKGGFVSLLSGNGTAKYNESKIHIRKSKIMNGKRVKTRAKVPCFEFIVPDQTKDFKIPFPLNGSVGRYKYCISWGPTVKLKLSFMLPSGGISHLNKKLPNTSPISKFIEIKNHNLSSNNKGKKAFLKISNTTGVAVTGRFFIYYEPLLKEEKLAIDTTENQNRTAEQLREINAALSKKIRQNEKRLNIMDGIIKGMKSQMRRLNQRLNKVVPETGPKG